MTFNAMTEHYEEITVCGTAGPAGRWAAIY